MRCPALHRPTAAPSGWSHPYTGPQALATFYNDGGDPAGDGTDPAGSETPKPAPPKTFTQEQVAALAAKEKSQGERAGARKALEELATANGFSNVDDVQAFIEEARKAREAQMSEQEREKQRLAEERQQFDRERQQLAQERRTMARERALSRLGATGADLEDATALLRVPDDADDDTVNEAAEALKTRRPELFGATSTQPAQVAAPPAPTGLPAAGMPRPGASQPKPGERGLEMLRRRVKLPAAS